MRKLTLFLAAVPLVLFAQKARRHELAFSIDPNARNSVRHSDLRVEESAVAVLCSLLILFAAGVQRL